MVSPTKHASFELYGSKPDVMHHPVMHEKMSKERSQGKKGRFYSGRSLQTTSPAFSNSNVSVVCRPSTSFTSVACCTVEKVSACHVESKNMACKL